MKRFLLALIAISMMTACAATEHDDETVDPAAIDPSLAGDAGDQYQGTYSGTMALVKNDCEGPAAEFVIPEELVADVVQSGSLVSMKFGEEDDLPGKFEGNDIVLIDKKKDGFTKIYSLTFSEDGIVGKLELSDSTEEGKLGEVCAEYSIDLKPAAE